MEKAKEKEAPIIGINIQMQEDRKTARYIQAGIMTEKGFTGLITDYCGGGQYQDFYYMDGKYMPDDDEDMGTIEDTLEKAVPGIIDAIYKIRDKYLDKDDVEWAFHANDELLTLLPLLPEDELFSSGTDITPVTCAMTIFPDDPSYKSYSAIEASL